MDLHPMRWNGCTIPKILSMVHFVFEGVKFGLEDRGHLFEAVHSLLAVGPRGLLVQAQRRGLAWVRDSPTGRFVGAVQAGASLRELGSTCSSELQDRTEEVGTGWYLLTWCMSFPVD